MKAYHGNMASGEPYPAAERRGEKNYTMYYIMENNKPHMAAKKVVK
jgi:hypothetical protein